jgi:hypothetical protein
VGGLLEVVSRVDNLGPGTSQGGTMRLEAIGDVELGEVPSPCTEIDPVAPVTAAIECPVDPLEPFGIDGVGPFRLTPLSAGDVQIVATVTPAPADVDVNPENDVNSRTWEIASTFLVDLEPVSPIGVDGLREPGSPLTARVRVGNYLPPSNGGTIVYEAIGDVVLGEVAERCTEAPNPSGVSVVCEFDAFVGYVNDTRGPGGETIRGWVGPFEVIPQSDGVVTFAATTVPVEGDTDVNPDNDRLEREVEIGDVPRDERSVDLEVVSLSAPGSASVDAAIDILVSIRNLGPDDSRGSFVTLFAFGDLEVGEVGASCVTQPPIGGENPAIVVRCEVGPLPAQSGSEVAFQVIPRSVGQVDLGAQVAPMFNDDRDTNHENDSAMVSLEVGPG